MPNLPKLILIDQSLDGKDPKEIHMDNFVLVLQRNKVTNLAFDKAEQLIVRYIYKFYLCQIGD